MAENSSAHKKLDQELRRTLAPMTRRKMLVGSLAFCATAAVGMQACYPGPKAVVPAEIQHLTGREYAVLQRVVQIFLPLEGTGLTPLVRVPMMHNIDEIFGALSPKVRSDLGMGLKLFQYGSIFVGFHFAPFTRLDDNAAHDYCDRWLHGNQVQRAIFSALKQFVYVSYWRDASTWGPVGYDGPVTKRLGHPRLGNAPSPEV